MMYCPTCGKEYQGETSCPDDGALLMPKTASTKSLIGTVLKDTYRIDKKLGHEGIATVFRASQLALERDVTVKVVYTDQDPTAVRRFYREANVLSKLSHPNIVRLLDFGDTEEGAVYFVLEHLTGYRLADYVATRLPLPLHDIADMMQQICSGVGAAHSGGLFHRDLKPANIFMAEASDKNHVAKILNFGLVKYSQKGQSALTSIDQLTGTPGYIAPELITGLGEASERSDVYSLGAVLYFILTGQGAYSGDNIQIMLSEQLKSPPQPVDCQQYGYPQAYAEIVSKAMATAAEDRYLSVDELAQAVTDVSTEISSQETQAVEIKDVVEVPQDQLDQQTQTIEHTTFPTSELKPPDPFGTAEKDAKKSRLPIILFIVLAALIMGYFLLFRSDSSESPSTTTSDAPKDGTQALDATSPQSSTPSHSHKKVHLGMLAAPQDSAQGKQIHAGLRAFFHSNKSQGFTLEVVMEQQESVSAAAKHVLFQDSKVLGHIGYTSGATTQETLSRALENKSIFFGAFSGAGFLEKDPPDRYVFNLRARWSQEIESILRFLVRTKKVPPDKIAILVQDDPTQGMAAANIKKRLRRLGHKKPKKILTIVQPASLDMAVKRVAKNKDEVFAIVVVAPAPQAGLFIKKLRNKKIKAICAVPSWANTDALMLTLDKAKFRKAVLVTQVVPDPQSDLPSVQQYRQAMTSLDPEQPLGFASLEGYLVGKLLATGMNLVGENGNSEKLIDALEAQKQLDLGIDAPCGFAPSRHQCLDKVWGFAVDKQGLLKPLPLPQPR